MIIPEAKDLRGTPKKPLGEAMAAVVEVLKAPMDWVKTKPSVKQDFCLKFLNACLQRIPVSKDFTDWTKEYHVVLERIGTVYCSYDAESMLQPPKTVSGKLSAEGNPSLSPKQYFHLILRIHEVLKGWERAIGDQTATYDFILAYKIQHRYICDVATAVSAKGLVVAVKRITDIEQAFLKEVENLNLLLLKYIPEDPKGRW